MTSDISYERTCITRKEQFQKYAYFTDDNKTLFRARIPLTEEHIGRAIMPNKVEKQLFFDVYYHKSREDKKFCYVGQQIKFLPRFKVKNYETQPEAFVGKVVEVCNSGEVLYTEPVGSEQSDKTVVHHMHSNNFDLILVQPIKDFVPHKSLAVLREQKIDEPLQM